MNIRSYTAIIIFQEREGKDVVNVEDVRSWLTVGNATIAEISLNLKVVDV